MSEGDAEEVRAALAGGADASGVVPGSGDTALHVACRRGCAVAVALLLQVAPPLPPTRWWSTVEIRPQKESRQESNPTP